MKKIFLVIPVHNEEKRIAKVLEDLGKVNLSIVVVDDGSRDNSQLIIKNLKLRNIIFLEHKVNLGKGAAMKTGAEYAFEKGAEAIIFMDSDGQHSPVDVSKFVGALETNKFDIVFGSRNLGFGVPLVRYLGNKVASVLLAMLFGVYISDAICGFRALTKKGYKKLKWESSGYGVEVEMVARTGENKARFTEVPVETIYHSDVKGVTLLDAFGILGSIVKWRLTI